MDALNYITQLILITKLIFFLGKILSLRETYLDALNSIIAEP